MLHYLFLVPSILEIQAQNEIVNYTSLNVKSNFKLRFYYLVKFYRNAFWHTIMFLCLAIYIIILDPSNSIGFLYLLFSPLLLINYKHKIHQAIIVLLPLIFLYYSYPLLIPIVFVTLIFHKNTIDISSSYTPISTSWIFMIGFLLFIFLLTLNQSLYIKQLLLLGAYILMTQISSIITASKKQTSIFKSRYILWSIKREYFSLKFLGSAEERKIHHSLYMILYCIFILFITKSLDVDILLMILFYIFMMLQEFDYLVHYQFFNQSILYDDFLSRILFRQFMSSSLAFYLLFLAVKEIFLIKNMFLSYSLFIQLGFISWCIFWSLFFFKRFKKKIKPLFLFVLLFLSACSKQDVTSMTIQDSRTFYSGKMLNKEIQEIFNIYDANTVLHINHGDLFKKGDLILSIKDPLASQEIERTNFQIKHLNDKIASLNNKLSTAEANEKPIIHNELSMLQDELKLLQFDKGLIKTTTYTYAPFDGTAYINESNMRLLSDALSLKIELSEHEYRTFKEIKNFKFTTLDDIEIKGQSNYLIEPTLEGYDVTFNDFEFDSYVNQSIIITSKEPILFVEAQYIRSEDDVFFVNVKDTECIVKVKYDSLKEGFYILEGVKTGDIIYAYH